MKIPFFNRFIIKTRSFYEMEEITDKTLREFLRNPWESEEQIGDALYGDSGKIGIVLEQIRQMLPVFCRIACRIGQGMDDTVIAEEEGVTFSYVAALHEIVRRQMPDDSDNNVL